MYLRLSPGDLIQSRLTIKIHRTMKKKDTGTTVPQNKEGDFVARAAAQAAKEGKAGLSLRKRPIFPLC